MQYAIVGCGPIGRNHARALAADRRISRCFFVDLQEERAAALAAEFGGEPLTSIDALPEGLAAASLTTPPASHFAVTKRLLQRGIAVLCEKPLAMTEREAAQLVLTSRRSGTPLMVGFKMRYDPIFRRAAELVHRAGPAAVGDHYQSTAYHRQGREARLAGSDGGDVRAERPRAGPGDGNHRPDPTPRSATLRCRFARAGSGKTASAWSSTGVAAWSVRTRRTTPRASASSIGTRC